MHSAVLAASLALSAASASAQLSFTIQPLTETTSKDAKIYSSVPTSNFTSNLNVTSADIGAHFLSLVQFDLSSLGAINANDITSATFTLYSTGIGASGGPVAGGDVTISPLLDAWRENSTDAGDAPLATYDAFFGGAPTIHYGNSIATQTVTTTGFVTWDITGLVKSWVNGSQANDGVLVQLATSGGDVGFADVDSSPGIAGSAPALTVHAVPEPSVVTLGVVGVVGLLSRRRRAGAARK